MWPLLGIGLVLSGACGGSNGDPASEGDAGTPVVTADANDPTDGSAASDAGSGDAGTAAADACALTSCGGACVDTDVDPMHCGRCDNACGAGRSCVAGECACSGGRTACGAECVDTTSDSSHCGMCGLACAMDRTCTGGECVCAAGTEECGGTCVDTSSDPSHCGACGTSCGAGGFCASGGCMCSGGLTMCDGQCTDISGDPAHCGGCTIACPAGVGCAAGQCGAVCSGTVCDGACVDTTTSALHCGDCNQPCASGFECVSGMCACPAGLTDCGGTCVDTTSHLAHCGACGMACGQGELCVDSSCECDVGLTDCSGSCVDTANDSANCGGCGILCPSGAVCSAGSCATPCTVGSCLEVQDVSAGFNTTCVVRSGGGVLCWGENGFGQLGVPGQAQGSSTPVQVRNLDPAVDVEADGGHACAITEAATLSCWGGNERGQLGDGTVMDTSRPATVTGLGDVVQVAVGGVSVLDSGTWRSYGHTCALVGTGDVYCWGANDFSQVGATLEGCTTCAGGGSTLPFFVVPMHLIGIRAIKVTVGTLHTCVLQDDGQVLCWGNGDFGQLGHEILTQTQGAPLPMDGVSDAIDVVADGFQTCILHADETVECFGNVSLITDMQDPQLGIAVTERLMEVVFMTPPGDPITLSLPGQTVTPLILSHSEGGASENKLAVGECHLCVLRSSLGGVVECNGLNPYGQLGDGTTTDRFTWGPVSNLVNASLLDVGWHHSCAAQSGGNLFCWGKNDGGQLGDGTTTNARTPVRVLLP